MIKKKCYYAVKNGRNIGIFETRKECKRSIHRFSNAVYQKFTSKQMAEKWLNISSVKNESLFKKNGENDYEAIVYVNSSFKDDVFTYGLVIFFDYQKLTFKEKFINEQWTKMKNVSGEIMGVIKAIQIANEIKIKSLLIYHNYSGIANWTDDKCAAKKDEIIAYQDFVMENRKNITIEFAKIEAQKKIKHNQFANKLAKEAYKLPSFSSVLLDLKQYKNISTSTIKETIQDKNGLLVIDSKNVIKTLNHDQEETLININLQLKMLMSGNENKLNPIVKIFLLGSLMNLSFSKKSFEYSDVCFQALKAIEAQIIGIFQSYPVFSQVASKNGYIFSKVFKKDKNKFIMNTKYKNAINSLKIVSILERMYTIYNMERNTTFHASLILLQTRIISTIEEAKSIVMNCIKLIDEYYT